MGADGPVPISVASVLGDLTFLADRAPDTTSEQAAGAFAQLAAYRDGGIFVGHWAGRSEWERHGVADEIVVVLEGATTITFRTADGERSAALATHDLVVVPKGTWHRFDTPEGVKLLSVTPQPTDHSTEPPA